MKNVIIRSLSGLLYVALIVAAILLWPRWPIAMLALITLFAALGIEEVHHICQSSMGERQPLLLTLLDVAGGVALLATIYLACTHRGPHQTMPLWSWTLVPAYVVVRMVAQLYLPRLNAVTSFARSMMAIVYVAFPLSLLPVVASLSNTRLVLALFIFIWLNDTGAFVVGSLLGKHRLWERISPKKSWEGVVGGLLFVLLGAWLIVSVFGDYFPGPMALQWWMGLGAVVVVGATFGDLFESLLKRTAGVKDSGNIIPGHGGILDRIDSLLLVTPLVLLYLIATIA